MNNEIQKTEEAPLMRIITLASTDGNIDADKLMKLLEVNERYEANEAKKAYVKAMAEFLSESPKIIKQKNGHNCKYASLADIVFVIAPLLSKHGLSHSWVTDTADKEIKVTCKITHVLGHSETTCLSAGPDTSGSKNAIQAIGSTITYLQRYTLKAALGLAEADQDDDGAGSEQKPPGVSNPSPKEQKIIDAICKKLPPVKGKRTNNRKIAAIMYAKNQKYPTESQIADAAEWFTKNVKPEMYMPENRSQFEIDQGMNGDADSVPDEKLREAEQTAKDKFGKKTEQKECRYICIGCDREFDRLNQNGLCPSCFSDKVTDRQEQNA